MARFIPFIMLALASLSAQADTLFGVHAASWHDVRGYNNVNPGVYIGQNSNVAGVYRNSERGTSLYVAHVFETEDKVWALTVGAVTGYRARPITPLLLPSMRIGDDKFAARISVVPAFKGSAMAAHISFETRF